jgi:hypothetical protein
MRKVNKMIKTKFTNPYDYDRFMVWGEEKGKSNVWSDRLSQWDTEKYNKCMKKVFDNESSLSLLPVEPNKIEKFLSLYFEKKIKLIGIAEECKSNGYPVWQLFFEEI